MNEKGLKPQHYRKKSYLGFRGIVPQRRREWDGLIIPHLEMKKPYDYKGQSYLDMIYTYDLGNFGPGGVDGRRGLGGASDIAVPLPGGFDAPDPGNIIFPPAPMPIIVPGPEPTPPPACDDPYLDGSFECGLWQDANLVYFPPSHNTGDYSTNAPYDGLKCMDLIYNASYGETWFSPVITFDTAATLSFYYKVETSLSEADFGNNGLQFYTFLDGSNPWSGSEGVDLWTLPTFVFRKVTDWTAGSITASIPAGTYNRRLWFFCYNWQGYADHVYLDKFVWGQP